MVAIPNKFVTFDESKVCWQNDIILTIIKDFKIFKPLSNNIFLNYSIIEDNNRF